MAAALGLANRLESERLPLGAMQSLLLPSEMLVQRGLADVARLALAHLRSHRLPPDLRLGVCDLEARLADARGLDVACRRWIRRGFAVLDHYQRSFAVRGAIGVDRGSFACMLSGDDGRTLFIVENH